MLLAKPIPSEIFNQGASILTTSNMISVFSLIVSSLTAWYHRRSNGPRVKISYLLYGPDVIPTGDRTYPKAALTIHVANVARTETIVESPLIHTGMKPRIGLTVLPTGSWCHKGKGIGNHFSVGEMASVEICLNEIMGLMSLIKFR